MGPGAWAVGLGHYGDDIVTRVDQTAEGGDREVRRTEERDPHYAPASDSSGEGVQVGPASWCSFFHRLTRSCRLSGER